MCGNTRVRRIPVRDRIDAMSAHPLSMLFGLLGAPIYHCNACRHQYHDWRSQAIAAEHSDGSSPGTDSLDFRTPPPHAEPSPVNEPTALMADAALQQRSDS